MSIDPRPDLATGLPARTVLFQLGLGLLWCRPNHDSRCRPYIVDQRQHASAGLFRTCAANSSFMLLLSPPRLRSPYRVPGPRQTAHEVHQIRDVFYVPIPENSPCQALTGLVDLVGQRLALRRDHRLAHPPVFSVVMSDHQFHALQLGDLAADGRVIPAQAICQLNHSNRTKSLDHHQKAKERLVQMHAVFLFSAEAATRHLLPYP